MNYPNEDKNIGASMQGGQALKNAYLLPRSTSSERKKALLIRSVRRKGASSGQALIVILLVSAIGLTIGLTLASRSTEETSITTELEESSRAFSAAEAGLEESIQHIGEGENVYTGSLGSAADFNVQVEIAGGQAGAFQFPGEIENNQTVTVWLTGHRTNSTTGELEIDWSAQYGKDTIDVCWGESGGPEGALEITYYSRDGTDYYIARQVLQPRGSNIVEGTVVTVDPTSSTVCGGEYAYRYEVNLTSMLGRVGIEKGFLRIRPIFPSSVTDGKTRLAVDSGTTFLLPTQGELHTSTGTTSGGHQTKIVQFISHPGPPELFDAVIFSEQALSK